MKTAEDVLRELKEELDKMTDEHRNQIFCSCACEKGHEYSMQSMYDAMLDPNNEDGQRFLKAAVDLANATEADPS